MSLLVNIENLLSGKIIESNRIEYKKEWVPDAILKSICAFANDFDNVGSGYIVVGVEEIDGKPVRPFKGFNPDKFEHVQKSLLNYCNQILPTYIPKVYLEEIDNIYLLVIWVPAGTNRPYKVPDNVTSDKKVYNYRIRQLTSSIVPKGPLEDELLQLTAKIPFDDRVNSFASISDLSIDLMREHLRQTKSKLFAESMNMSIIEIAERMNLTQGTTEHLFPKNVGLLMFSESINKYFPEARIEVVEFPDGPSGYTFSEKIFTGPIQKQLSEALNFIKSNFIKSIITKNPNIETADYFINYPFSAIEEALSNAVYHKNYEEKEPIEVRILPSSIEIISYNGPDPSLKQKDFQSGIVRARRYRNRRIGDFLKELRLTEGRGTGIPLIINSLKENGSPNPIFDINEPDRFYFLIEIPIHPAYIKHELGKRELEVLEFCNEPKSRIEILNHLSLKNHTDNYEKYIRPLIQKNLLEPTDKNNLRSRSQKYIVTTFAKLSIIQKRLSND